MADNTNPGDMVGETSGPDDFGPEPILENGLFETLLEDHEEIRNLFDQVLQTMDDDPQRAELWNETALALMVHSHAEQEVVYRRLLDDDDVRRDTEHAIEEHEEIEDLIRDVDALDVSDPDFLPMIERLQERVDRHVTEEEHELLPRAEEVIGRAELDLLVPRFLQQKDKLERKLGDQRAKDRD